MFFLGGFFEWTGKSFLPLFHELINFINFRISFIRDTEKCLHDKCSLSCYSWRTARNCAKTVPFRKISTPGNHVKLRYFSQWSNESGSYFSDESDTKTKNIIKTVTWHKLYIKYLHLQCGIHLNEVMPFHFQFFLLNSHSCVISENINGNSTDIDCLFDAQIQSDSVW